MSSSILEVRNLCKTFGKQEAVSDVSLSIPRNQVFGLLGPNGAGKSTLLKMITGIMTPNSGDIYFEGQPWVRENLKDIGALIENPAIYPNLTAKENLSIACKLHQLPDSRIQEVLDIVGLEVSDKKKVKNFSMGMKQRLGLGMALIHSPKLLILDEPTNGLDPIGIEDLRQLIQTFPSQEITVILSSHILSEVSQVADEIAIISNGVIGYQGQNEQIDNLEELFMDVVRHHGGGTNG